VTHLGYLLVGWGVWLAALALYGFRVVARGRRLSTRVPADRQRWMTTRDRP
jgi:hypothetical protein